MEGQHGARATCAPLQAFLSVVVSYLLVASKYSFLPRAAWDFSKETTFGSSFVKLKSFPAAAVVLLEKVFQVEFLVNLQEETGSV